MLADLEALFANLPNDADHAAYERAIREDNVLGKKTASTRLWAWKKLRELYALDGSVPVYKLLRTYWDRDTAGRPLLACLAALARDGLLRTTAPVITETKPGDQVTRELFKAAVVEERGDRFSETTMKSLTANVMSSWGQTGHITSGSERVRVRVSATTATTAYALALSYMTGARGEFLFSTLWARVLDAPPTVLHDHAREASRLGWLTYRGVGSILDITFPKLSFQPE
jgi:hypothetical protein